MELVYLLFFLLWIIFIVWFISRINAMNKCQAETLAELRRIGARIAPEKAPSTEGDAGWQGPAREMTL